jgi:hypothetical protein
MRFMSRFRKVLTISLAVLFLVSLTVAASGAEPSREHKHLDHVHLGDKDHNDHDDHNNHHHDDNDCWAWSPTKEQWVYIC